MAKATHEVIRIQGFRVISPVALNLTGPNGTAVWYFSFPLLEIMDVKYISFPTWIFGTHQIIQELLCLCLKQCHWPLFGLDSVSHHNPF